jgi:hypothetical protein
MRLLPATYKQQQFLKSRGHWHEGLSRADAWDLIARIILIDSYPSPAWSHLANMLPPARRATEGQAGADPAAAG